MAKINATTEPFEELIGGDHAVLLIHGLSGTPSEVIYLAKKLHLAGFTVRVPLLPSRDENISDQSSESWMCWHANVSEHFDDLNRSHKAVSIAGLCSGAVLALYLAAEKGDKVTSLSLMSTTLFFDGWALPWYRFLLPLFTHTPLRHILAFDGQEPYGIKNERLRERVAKNIKEDDSRIAYPGMPMSSIYEMQKMISATKACLHEIKTPTLILHAEEDDVASLKNADYLESHLGASDIKRVTLHNSYHLITVDNERDMVAEETATFLWGHTQLSSVAQPEDNHRSLAKLPLWGSTDRIPSTEFFTTAQQVITH